jgi:hypothetical protein
MQTSRPESRPAGGRLTRLHLPWRHRPRHLTQAAGAALARGSQGALNAPAQRRPPPTSAMPGAVSTGRPGDAHSDRGRSVSGYGRRVLGGDHDANRTDTEVSRPEAVQICELQ